MSLGLISRSSRIATSIRARPVCSLRTSARFYAPPAQHHPQRRAMADSTAAATTSSTSASSQPATQELWEWLVVVPDKPGSREKRLEARPTHLENISALAADTEKFKMGGVILSDVPADASAPQGWDFAGSTLVVKAASRQEIVDLIKDDIYVRAGVWDMDKLQAWPFKAAFRRE